MVPAANCGESASRVVRGGCEQAPVPDVRQCGRNTGEHRRAGRAEMTGAMAQRQDGSPVWELAPATDDEGDLHLGCSMLRRTRLFLNGYDRPAMRCSLGYSVRTEADKQRCLAAEGPNECWHLTAAKQ